MLTASILGSLIFPAKSYFLIAYTILLDGVLQTLEEETDCRRGNLEKWGTYSPSSNINQY